MGTKHESLWSTADYITKGASLYRLQSNHSHYFQSLLHTVYVLNNSWCFICSFSIICSLTSFYVNWKNSCSTFKNYLNSMQYLVWFASGTIWLIIHSVSIITILPPWYLFRQPHQLLIIRTIGPPTKTAMLPKYLCAHTEEETKPF